MPGCIPFKNPGLYRRYYYALSSWNYTLTKSYAKMLKVYFANAFLATVEAELKVAE